VSKASRDKGAAGELEVVHILQDHGWKRARRTHDGREQSLRGDIANGPEGIHLEIKRAERCSIWDWWEQANLDSVGLVPHEESNFKTPVVAFRRSRSPWLALIELDELLPLLKLRESS
jgi:Holliday junction resolvase